MSNDNSGDQPNVGFRKFVTPVLVVIIWWLTIIATLIGYGIFHYQMHQASLNPWGGPTNKQIILSCFIGLGIAVANLLVTRVFLELVVVVFRIEKHLRRSHYEKK